MGVAITAFATWTPGGVRIGALPDLASAGHGLGPWPDAPPLEKIHPRARRPIPAARAVVQLSHALFASRQRAGPLDLSSVGICLGSASGSAAADADFAAGLAERGEGFGSPATFVYTLPTTVLGEVAIALGLRGEIAAVSAGNASGLSAIATAASWVQDGHARVCLGGGVEIAASGSRRAFAVGGVDSIVLFLIERSQLGVDGPIDLTDWQTGFGDPPAEVREAVGDRRDPFLGNGALIELARIAAGDGAAVGKLDGLLACSGLEGFWATVRYRRKG
jgi:hypothetical protein